jgi:hypothetical protein
MGIPVKWSVRTWWSKNKKWGAEYGKMEIGEGEGR